jgi:peptidoglycan/LPS O-acetylase OafA/YrhL
VAPDLLRALAILLVMSWHIPKAGLPPVMITIRQFGWLGVDIFFVLSGFLIGSEIFRQLGDGGRVDLKVFYAKRILRIWPAFLVILAVYLLWPNLRESPHLMPVWRLLTFTANFGLDYRITGAFTHVWSLCVEEQFYLALPLMALALHKFRSPWATALLVAAIVIAGMVWRAYLWQHWHATGGDTADVLRVLYYPSYTRLDGLLMGVLLAAATTFRHAAWQRFAPAWATASSALGCLLICGYWALADGITLSPISAPLFYPLFAFGMALLLSTLLRIEPRLQWLRWSGAGFIAGISYSLYLSHKLVMHAVKVAAPIAWRDGWTGVALHYGASIAVATLLFIMVERPVLALRPLILRRLAR